MRVKTRAELPKDDPPTKTDGNETDAIVILTSFNGTFISDVVNVNVCHRNGTIYILIEFVCST